MNTHFSIDIFSIPENTTRAIVLGAGMTGLQTASVLARYYNQVIIVERDFFSEHPHSRPRTPQAFQLHLLLLRGQQLLEELFPGLCDELLTQKTVSYEQKRFILTGPYGQLSFISDKPEIQCSRALLEHTIYQRVQAHPNIHFLAGHYVTGLQMTEDTTRVTGIVVRERGKKKVQILPGHLIIAANGRNSNISQ